MQLSVTQYAKKRKITRQAVLKQIKKNKILPYIESYEKVGETYILYAIVGTRFR